MLQQALRAQPGMETAMPMDVPVRPRTLSARPPVSVAPAARFGQGGGHRLPVLLGVLLLHVALVAVLLTVRQHLVHKREAQLTLIDLSVAPPPPPAAAPAPEPERPTLVEPTVTVPQPLVQVPQLAAPVLAATPQPVPVAVPVPTLAPSTGIAPAPPAVVQANDLDSRMIAGKPPRYPLESRRRKEQGTVLLSLVLGLDGSVSSISVAQSSGFARLDDAALDAVRKWRWEPTLRGGQPVLVKGIVRIPFVLN